MFVRNVIGRNGSRIGRLRVFAGDADQTTVSFHTMLARLRRSQERGELQLCELRDERRVILRTPLVEAETSQ